MMPGGPGGFQFFDRFRSIRFVHGRYDRLEKEPKIKAVWKQRSTTRIDRRITGV